MSLLAKLIMHDILVITPVLLASAHKTLKPPVDDPGARGSSEEASIMMTGPNGDLVECTIWARDNIHDFVQQMEDEQDINLFKFLFRFDNYTLQVRSASSN